MLTQTLSPLKRVQPSFIEPMYAEAVRVLPDGGLWTYEAKLDGYRCLAAQSNPAELRSGRGAAMDLRTGSLRSPGLARSYLPTR